MTKQSYFWATPSGPINLMKAENMPPSHHSEGWYKKYCESHNHANPEQSYQADLQAAKESSVPIQDQDRALQLMWENDPKINNPISFGDWKHHKLYLGKVYGPFNCMYRIEDACAHESCPVDGMCEHCKEPVKVAILLPEKEPQEDQEDIFDEVFCRYFDIIYRDSKSMHDAVSELMERFTITRKQ